MRVNIKLVLNMHLKGAENVFLCFTDMRCILQDHCSLCVEFSYKIRKITVCNNDNKKNKNNSSITSTSTTATANTTTNINCEIKKCH